MESNILNRSVLGLVSIEIVGKLLGRIFQFLLSTIIARQLGADGLGSYAFALTLLIVLSTASRCGFDTAFVKFIPVEKGNSEKLSGTIISGFFITLLIGVFVFLIAQLGVMVGVLEAKYRFNAIFGLFIAATPVLGFLKLTESIMRGFNRTDLAVIVRDIFFQGFVLLTVAVLLQISSSQYMVGISYLIGLIIATIGSILLIARMDDFSLSFSPSFEINKKLNYSLPMVGVKISNQAIIWTDILLIGLLLNSSSVGYYRAAYEIAIILTFVLAVVNGVFPAIASDLYEQNETGMLSRLYNTASVWIVGLSIFGALFVTVYNREILLIFGDGFRSSSIILYILVVGRVADASVGPAGFLLSMTGNERIEFANTLVISIINLVLNYVLIEAYGAVGAAIATSISLFILSVVRVLELKHFLNVKYYPSRIYKFRYPLVIVVLIMYVIYNIGFTQVIEPIIVLFLCGPAYLILSYYFVYNPEEDREIISKINNHIIND